MLKKLNYLIGIITILVALLVLLQKFGVLHNLPVIFNYWSGLIAVMGFVNVLQKKKFTLENLTVMFVGLILLSVKLGLTF